MVTKEEILEAISQMSVVDLVDLIKQMEEKFNVSAQMAVAAAPAAAVPVVETAEEKSSFDVILKTVGDKKVNVIKVVRTFTSLGLKEAKDLVDAAPKPIKEGINKEEADDIKKQLEEAGASVEIK